MSRNDRKLHEEQGFTLVELLVVIMIIGLLAAIAIPIFMNQQKTARDATVVSDAKNAAAQVTTALAAGYDGTKIAQLSSQAGNYIVMGSYGQGKTPPANTNWNAYPELPQITVSDGNQVTVTIALNTSGNYVKHEPGEFCLSVNGANSKNYNYSEPGVTGPGNYDHLVYYDVSLGGIVTMDQMITDIQSGGNPSCGHFARGYMTAKGISTNGN